MCEKDYVIASYNAARNEISARINIRTRILGFYLAASGALVSFALKDSNAMSLLQYMAWFAFAVALMVSHHNIAIAATNNFLTDNLQSKFGSNIMWSGTEVGGFLAFLRRTFRAFSEFLITLLPVILLSYLAYMDTGDSCTYFEFLWLDELYWPRAAFISIFLVYLMSFCIRQSAHNRSVA